MPSCLFLNAASPWEVFYLFLFSVYHASYFGSESLTSSKVQFLLALPAPQIVVSGSHAWAGTNSLLRDNFRLLTHQTIIWWVVQIKDINIRIDNVYTHSYYCRLAVLVSGCNPKCTGRKLCFEGNKQFGNALNINFQIYKPSNYWSSPHAVEREKWLMM